LPFRDVQDSSRPDFRASVHVTNKQYQAHQLQGYALQNVLPNFKSSRLVDQQRDSQLRSCTVPKLEDFILRG
jgi:hypothetical protein